jgi:hypothetical protein
MRTTHPTIRFSIIGFSLAFLLVSMFMATFIVHTTHAAPVVEFKPGRIIEDSVFTNSNSMSPSQIHTFLNSKISSCDTNGTQPSEFGGGTRAQWGTAHGYPPPYTCLPNYIEGGRAAAQIIYDVAQYYAINPQTLIVLLQKEQGLVTDTWPLSRQYRTATGYGCPDTAPCDSQYYGLTNQLTWSAKMFRAILNNSSTWYTPYILGNNTIKWNPVASCGSSVVNIENRATQALYNYTPYRPNQAALNAGYGTGDSCSAYGNRNFYLYFRDWFGYNSGPAAFKTAGSSTIYMPINGYKFIVPHTAVMQDFGISVEAVQTVSQAYADAVPAPETEAGLSTSISHVIKSPRDDDEDGASVYLISRGKRYQIQTMQQFANFGLQESEISYLPLGYINTMDNGGMLPNFVTSPQGNVFKVDSTKHLIFQYSTYISQNPSDQIGLLSYYLIDRIPSGTPITTGPVMIKYSDNETVYVLQNGHYYTVSTFNAFNCWGLNGPANIPLFRVAQNNYIASITPTGSISTCVTNDGSSIQVLNTSSRLTVPGGYGLTGTSINADLKALQEQIPLRTAPLKQHLKANDSAAVWFIDSGKRRLIPSYIAFTSLGLSAGDVDVISPTLVNSLAENGIKLADGELVKDPSSSAIYVIAGDKRLLYPSSDIFLAYRNNWNSIETYTSTQLDQHYPFEDDVVGNILVNASAGKAYIVTTHGCFTLSNSNHTALGMTYSSLSAAQNYTTTAFTNINLSSCAPATNFIKESNHSLVYWVDGGQRHPITTYNAMLNKNGGTAPVVMEVNNSFLSQIPVGSSL